MLLLLLLLLLQISGDVNQVADACDANPACLSFDMDGSSGGFLRGAGPEVYTVKTNNYCKLDSDQICTGEKATNAAVNWDAHVYAIHTVCVQVSQLRFAYVVSHGVNGSPGNRC
jgi:hypothetical protein